MKFLRWLAVAAALLGGVSPAAADFLFTQGSGTTGFAFTCFSTKVCFANVVTNSAGTEIFTNANPASVGTVTWGTVTLGPTAVVNYGTTPAAAAVPGVNAFITNTVTISGTVTANQGTAGGTPWPVSGTVTANQGGAPWTVNPGTPANWALGATAAAVPANAIYLGANVGGNLTGLTGTGTSLNVNITGGAGAGGTSLADRSAFTQGTTAITPIGCLFITSYTAMTSPMAGVASCTSGGALNVNVVNATTLGRQLSTASSPVVQPSAPNTSAGGGSVSFPVLNATASANANLIKNAATTLMGCQMGNISSAAAFLHIFNKATAPTPGTDSAVKTLIIPVQSTGALGAGSNVNFGPGGFALATGFGLTITGGIGTIDNTTIATANQIVVNCDFE